MYAYIFQLHIFSGSLDSDFKFLVCPVNFCIFYTELSRMEILAQPLRFSLAWIYLYQLVLMNISDSLNPNRKPFILFHPNNCVWRSRWINNEFNL